MTVYDLTAGSSAHEVDPISRIEGHLGVKVSCDASGKIIDANAHGNLWRGFENFLLGRDVNDAITFVQRICGVCPVPHGMTSTYAVDSVFGYSRGHITFKQAAESTRTYGVPEKAVLIRNLVLASEFLMSSITHFYHLVAPSYIQGPAIPPWTPYFNTSYYGTVLRSNGAAVPKVVHAHMKAWDSIILSYVKALKIRRMTFEAGALFAGRMPMTSCYVGGGVTNDHTENMTAKVNKFVDLMTTVAGFVVSEYVPIALALGALYPEYDNTANHGNGWGAGLGRFLAWGGFPNLDDSLALPGGVFEATTAYHAPGALDVDDWNFRVLNKADVYAKFLDGGTRAVKDHLTEDISHSRYGIASQDTAVYTSNAAFPGDVSRTKPARANGYTYIKAPRWGGKACEVGPFARLAVAGYYPVDGTHTLASVVPGYVPIYTTSGASSVTPGVLGLDTRVLSGDLVAGLSGDSLVSTVNSYILTCKGGLSTMDRIRARAIESLVLCQSILGTASKDDAGDGSVTFDGTGWAGQLLARANDGNPTWRAKPGAMPASGIYTSAFNPYGLNHGWGGTEAPRGALMHQVTVQNGKIQKYQCIVPTTWNGSPKDTAGHNGAIEASVIGANFANHPGSFTNQNGTTSTSAGGVEVLRIAQSFDPCIACAIH